MIARIGFAGMAVLGLALLAIPGAGDFQSAVHGWLTGFVFISLAPAGALVLVMIARLTAAPWGRDFDPELRAIGAATPWLWLLGLPLALLLGVVYPWARPDGAPQHLTLYLSPWAFLLRSAAALAGWSLLAFLIWRRRGGQRLAALGLVFQAVVLVIIPTDWALSVQPGWTTTDIGMAFLTLEVTAAGGALLLFGPAGPRQSRDDIAGFLIAGVLGLMYLTFVAYLIDWYGDLPDRVDWWLARLVGGRWIPIALAMTAGVGVFAVLAFGRRYRVAGALALAGVASWCVWLFAPTLGPWPWLTACGGILFHAAVIAFAAALLWREPARPEPHHV
jgi:hypothetical protein